MNISFTDECVNLVLVLIEHLEILALKLCVLVWKKTVQLLIYSKLAD